MMVGMFRHLILGSVIINKSFNLWVTVIIIIIRAVIFRHSLCDEYHAQNINSFKSYTHPVESL